MKFFTLLAFVGFAAASSLHGSSSGSRYGSSRSPLESHSEGHLSPLLYGGSGHELTYEYTGRLLTGIPELNTHHYAGISVKCEVVLEVRTGGRMVLRVRNARFAHANGELQPTAGDQEGHNWRHLKIPQGYSPVPEESRRQLEKKVLLELDEQLKVRSLVASSEEPEWSVNFKKALFALFQTGSVRPYTVKETVETRLPSMWRSFEQSPDGECEAHYTMKPISESQKPLYNKPEQMSESESRYETAYERCPSGSRLYEITKVRDLDTCIRSSIFWFSRPGTWNCESQNPGKNNYYEKYATGSCGSQFSRSSVTKYVVCGQGEESFFVQDIVNEGELYTVPTGLKTEKMLTGTRQVLKLVSKARISREMSESEIPSPVTHESIMQTFGKKEEHENEIRKMTAGLLPLSESSDISREELVRKAEEILKNLVDGTLLEIRNFPEAQNSYKILILAKMFKMFDRTMLNKVYEKMVRSESGVRKEIMSNIVVDTMVMSGSSESIKFFLSLVESHEIPQAQIASIFFNLPRTVVTPNEHLLEQIFEVIKSEAIKSKPFVYRTALLSFSNLVEKSCLAHSPDYSYPTTFGRMCSKESSIVSEKWIPYLENIIRTTEGSETHKQMRYTSIVALGLLSHEQVVPILLPVIESQESSHTARYLAIYSLIRTGVNYRNHVLPVVSAIMSNKAEPTDIRIAAFHVIMAVKPDTTLLQKIAVSTWYEKDTEVLRSINSAFYSTVFETSVQDYSPETSELIRRVRLIYPTIKKTGGEFVPSSGVVYSNEFLNRMKVGYESVLAWTSSRDSLIPETVYSKLNLMEGEEFTFTPYEIAVHLREIFPTLYDSVSNLEQTPFEEIKSKVAVEWRKTIDQLRLKLRKSEKSNPEAFLYMNIFEDSTLFLSLAKSSTEELKDLLRNPAKIGEYLSGSKTFEFQRAIDMSPSEGMIPSEFLGLPIYNIVSMPTLINLRGRIGGETDLTRGKLEMKFDAMVDRRLIGSVGTLCPFTGEFFSAAIDQQSSIVLPMEFDLSFNLPEGKIEAAIKFRTQSPSVSAPYDIFHYSVMPFTVKQKFSNFKPAYRSGNMKPIRSMDTPSERQEVIPFGEDYGLNLKLKYKSETPYFGVRYYLEKLYNLGYNPVNYFRFPNSITYGLTPSGIPSARRHMCKITYDPTSSHTKEIRMTLSFGYASKEQSEGIRYHKIEKSSMGGLKIKSEPIGQMPGQPKRQEMLKSIFERNQIEREGRGFTVILNTVFSGSSSRAAGQSFTYSATFATGLNSESSEQKWDLKLHSERSSEAICVVGHLTLPAFHSKFNVERVMNEQSPVFRYHNVIGYGSECSESKVIIDGYAKTSESQKSLARKTPEAKEYERLLRKQTPMIKTSELADKVRIQASALDEIRYQIKFHNVGRKVNYVVREGLEGLQVYWLPYYAYPGSVSSLIESSSEEILSGESYLSTGNTMGTSGKVSSLDVRTKVHPLRKTYDVEVKATIESSQEVTYAYTEIPLPYPFAYMYPLSYDHFSYNSATKFLTGKPIYPVCSLEGKHISTYDNRTYSVENMDDCFHLLSADCSKALSHSVLVRNIPGTGGRKQVKIMFSNGVELTTPESSSEHSILIKKEREGSSESFPVPSQKGWKAIKHEGKIFAKVIRYTDGTIEIRSPKVGIIFDGHNVQLLGSNLLKDQTCGLCGDNNNQKKSDLLSPRKCVLSSPELIVASYRVGSLPSKQCRPMPEHIKSKLVEEESRCVKPSSPRTPLTSSYLSSVFGPSHESESCSQLHHEIVDKRDELCFSRIPILECGTASGRCHPVGIREKEISYTCMSKESRSTEYIAEKIRDGEVVPDLKRRPVSFSVRRMVPVDCKPYRGF